MLNLESHPSGPWGITAAFPRVKRLVSQGKRMFFFFIHCSTSSGKLPFPTLLHCCRLKLCRKSHPINAISYQCSHWRWMDGSVERRNPCSSAEGGRPRAAGGGVQLLCVRLILQYISGALRVTEPLAPSIHHGPSQNHQTSGMRPHHRSHINPQQPANT